MNTRKAISQYAMNVTTVYQYRQNVMNAMLIFHREMPYSGISKVHITHRTFYNPTISGKVA